MKNRRYIKLMAAVLTVCLFIPLFTFGSVAITEDEMQDFLDIICPLAVQDMRDTGILASLTIAQAIHESGYGTSNMASKTNNLFGIKAYAASWDGRVYCTKTGTVYSDFEEAEAIIGSALYATYRSNFFRVYRSWAESLKDHSRLFLVSDRYENLRGLTDYKLAARYVVEDGYCDSPDYTDKLINYIEMYELYNYDLEAIGDPVEQVVIGAEIICLEKGESITVYPTVLPDTAVSKAYAYSVSDKAVASVSDGGVIKALASGNTVLTVESVNGKSSTALIFVTKAGETVNNAVTSGSVYCRSVPSGDGGNSTILGYFKAGTDVLTIGEPVGGWYLVYGKTAGNGYQIGYSYKSYLDIGTVFEGDNPEPPSEEPSSEEPSSEEPSSEEPSSEEPSSEESSSEEPSSEESSSEEPSSEEPSSEEPSSEEPLPGIDTDYAVGITTGRLNQRVEPNSSAKLIGTFASGTQLLLIGEPENGWYRCIGVSESGKTIEGYSGATYINRIGGLLDTTGLSFERNAKNGYITGIAPSTMVSSLKEAMALAALTVKNKDGNEMSEDEILTTGCTLSFAWNGKTYYSSEMYIIGDVNCDGKVGVIDYINVRLALLGADTLEGTRKAAALVSAPQSGELSLIDYITLRLYLIGLAELKDAV